MTTLTMVLTLLLAHHGGAVFQAESKTLKGTVTEFTWANPHVQIYFDVKDEKGNVVHWACETISPGKLVRGSGWKKTSLKAGDQITITLQQAKTGAPVGNLRKIVLADGTTLSPTENAPEY